MNDTYFQVSRACYLSASQAVAIFPHPWYALIPLSKQAEKMTKDPSCHAISTTFGTVNDTRPTTALDWQLLSD